MRRSCALAQHTDEVPYLTKNLIRNTLIFFNCRTEIASLTEKIRSLEIAQVYQRKQQAIAIAALAAEKLKKRPHLNEFHSSDSNLAYDYSTSNNANENQNGTMNTGTNARRIQTPIGKRLLLKVCFLLKWKNSFHWFSFFFLSVHSSDYLFFWKSKSEDDIRVFTIPKKLEITNARHCTKPRISVLFYCLIK